ncbi:uncharacterized protein LOC111699151 isoform X2 [Eurytemora carolleeae]|uniref:uncharacterized protein LOC111699151 isoform X2 n=1 Tax=Eurytemora carolleeae TaxID=1294199 RepID=UPI000C7943DC|nr:uncharacterized protein LOC111699151 isoform X2 [Eurytemora carolleeae]|eukprot:XP_023325511.1 uncharacterized protein LOC111699151 isoform X2 [Eurytemora affinis]
MGDQEVSPPGTITESTLLDKNTPNQSETPNFSNISSPGYGGSPNLSRNKSKMESASKSKLSSPDKDKQNPSSKLNKSKTKETRSKTLVSNSAGDSQESDVDQPSGKTRFVGDSINRSRSMSRSAGHTNIKSRRPTSTEPTPLPEKSSLSSVWVIALLLAAIVVVAAVVLNQQNTRSAEDWETHKKSFRHELQMIRHQFPGQTSESFKHAFIALSTGMQKAPDRPGVLVLLSSPGEGRIVSCLMENLLRTSAPYFRDSNTIIEEMMINGSLITNSEQFHNLLQEKMSKHGVVGVQGLEKISGKAAIALHAFADDSNAPYKHGFLLLSLEGTGFQEPCLPSRKAEELLSEYWNDLEEDKIPPLITRVTADVIEVNPETPETIQNICSHLQD